MMPGRDPRPYAESPTIQISRLQDLQEIHQKARVLISTRDVSILHYPVESLSRARDCAYIGGHYQAGNTRGPPCIERAILHAGSTIERRVSREDRYHRGRVVERVEGWMIQVSSMFYTLFRIFPCCLIVGLFLGSSSAWGAIELPVTGVSSREC